MYYTKKFYRKFLKIGHISNGWSFKYWIKLSNKISYIVFVKSIAIKLHAFKYLKAFATWLKFVDYCRKWRKILDKFGNSKSLKNKFEIKTEW